MTDLQVVGEPVEDTVTAALAAVQAIHDGAMALFAEVHRDWHELSREMVGKSLPWPDAEDFPRAA